MNNESFNTSEKNEELVTPTEQNVTDGGACHCGEGATGDKENKTETNLVGEKVDTGATDGACAVSEKPTKARIVRLVVSFILVLVANIAFFGLFFLKGRYDHVYLDQLLYQLKASIVGTSSNISGSAVIDIGLYTVILMAVDVFIWLLLSGNLAFIGRKIKYYAKFSQTVFAQFVKKYVLGISAVTLVLSLLFFAVSLDVFGYLYITTTDSDFIEENYVEPTDVSITFPEQKRNLIYIFVESMENTFGDTGAGGPITDNFIKELVDLRDANISFSNTADSHGGAYSYMGTTWTASALVTQTAGITLKVPLLTDEYDENEDYLPGAYTIGDVLGNAGYNQVLLFGSDARFADRKPYFVNHGNYKIVDTKSLKDEGRLPEDYMEWWGFEDEKLFTYAKEELTKLGESGEPFNFTMLTADSHFPSGYVCDLCPDIYKAQYPNVLTCTARQVKSFVEWIQAQDFYENTTIVISGDHLTMDPEFLVDIKEGYTRTVYNCIINSAITTDNTKNREFGTFDMYPTTLASLGVKIEGDRLALGTNLFSGEKTLTEKYGYEYLDKELMKDSDFYMKKLYEIESLFEK